jgi:hypothetical protein
MRWLTRLFRRPSPPLEEQFADYRARPTGLPGEAEARERRRAGVACNVAPLQRPAQA